MAHTKRVARGARWLDKHNPGWENRVNTQTLTWHSDTGCVIGQVREGFTEFMDRRYFTGWLEVLEDYPKLEVVCALLYPGVWFGVRFAMSHGFVSGRETEEAWRGAWANEILTRRNRKRKELHRKIDDEHRGVLLSEEPLYVPTTWEKDATLV